MSLLLTYNGKHCRLLSETAKVLMSPSHIVADSNIFTMHFKQCNYVYEILYLNVSTFHVS